VEEENKIWRPGLNLFFRGNKFSDFFIIFIFEGLFSYHFKYNTGLVNKYIFYDAKKIKEKKCNI